MKKVLIIFGTRPEAIKQAMLVKEFQKQNLQFETRVCVTAQHREMLDQVLSVFEIIPDYDLNVMKPNQSLSTLTSNIILKINPVLEEFKPDFVFVQGDTTTAFVASLACFYKKITICHIEAGLRTGNILSPYPEEANRKLISVIANYHFAPTAIAKENLIKENYSRDKIYVTGNTVIDALLYVVDKFKIETFTEKIKQTICDAGYNITSQRKILLVTGHRRENIGQGIINICLALSDLAQKYSNLDIVYPVHLNPEVRKTVNKYLSGISNIHIIEPLEYVSFIFLMNKCDFILTDSGGIQEEAPTLGKPVLVSRTTTERPEAVETNVVKLVGTEKERIITEVSRLIDDTEYYKTMTNISNPYGDGNSVKKIVDIIKKTN